MVTVFALMACLGSAPHASFPAASGLRLARADAPVQGERAELVARLSALQADIRSLDLGWPFGAHLRANLGFGAAITAVVLTPFWLLYTLSAVNGPAGLTGLVIFGSPIVLAAMLVAGIVVGLWGYGDCLRAEKAALKKLEAMQSEEAQLKARLGAMDSGWAPVVPTARWTVLRF